MWLRNYLLVRQSLANNLVNELIKRGFLGDRCSLGHQAHLRPAPVLCFKETKKGLVLSGTNQDALQALFGDDVTGCFGKRVLLEPTPMRVAGRELVVIRIKAAPASSGTSPKTSTGDKVIASAEEAQPGTIASE